MGFPFVCPKCKNSWLLNEQEFHLISEHLPLVCRECGNEFDILNGVKETIATDNPFLQHALRSNHVLAGKSDVTPCQVKEVNLENHFSEIHKVFLTPEGPTLLYCTPVKAGNSKFHIVSSRLEGYQYPEKINVQWLVYGNKAGMETPLWRQLLSNAKGYEIDGNFRMEIVELESTFEVFLTEHLKPKLEKKATGDIVETLFNHFKRMEDVTTHLFKIATGETLKERLRKLGKAELLNNWQKAVKEKRDGVLHRGEKVDQIEAKKAFETVFQVIILLEPKALEYLYTSFEVMKEERGSQ